MSRPRTTRLLPAVAAVLVLALTGCGSEASDDKEPAGDSAAAETASEAPADDSSSAGTAELTVADSAAAGKCMVPNAEVLATQTTAFEGTVTALEDGTATLEVDRWFAGEEAEQVTVAAPSKDLQALIEAVDFEVGTTYLVSASDGEVSLCGFTDEKSPELEALYTEAFPS